MADEIRRWFISGRVQGVFFRASTRRQADSLGLSGHAVNLEDGRVEVVARGPTDRLEQLEAWLHRGPAGARVDNVECSAAEDLTVPAAGFRTA